MVKNAGKILSVEEVERSLREDKESRKKGHEIHSSIRMLQRFRSNFSARGQKKVVELIRSSGDRYLVTKSRIYKEGIYRVPYIGKWVYIVYNDHIKSIITVLPDNNKYKRLYDKIMIEKENGFLEKAVERKEPILRLNVSKKGPPTFEIRRERKKEGPLTFSSKFKKTLK